MQVCVWSEAAANGSADNTPAVATTTTAAPSTSDASWCDLTSVFKDWGYDSFTGGPIRMRFWSGSKMYYSTVTCVASKCKGTNGQTNACQYICGEDKCDGKHLEPVTLEEILAGETNSPVFQK